MNCPLLGFRGVLEGFCDILGGFGVFWDVLGDFGGSSGIFWEVFA